MNHAHIRWQTYSKCCMCSDYSPNWTFLYSVPLLGPPCSLRHSSIGIRPVNNPAVAFECSSERKSHTSPTLNQKLEIINLSKEGDKLR